MASELETQMSDLLETLLLEAAQSTIPIDEEALDAFAVELSGLEGLDCDQMLERLEGSSVPGGFRHVVVTSLNDGEMLCESYSVRDEPLEMKEIIIMIDVSLEQQVEINGPAVWTETVIRPTVNAGVLELGVRFTPLN